MMNSENRLPQAVPELIDMVGARFELLRMGSDDADGDGVG